MNPDQPVSEEEEAAAFFTQVGAQYEQAAQSSLVLLNEAETALWSAVEPLRREVRRLEGESSVDYEDRALTHLEAVDQALARCSDALEELLGFHHHFMSRISGAAVSRRTAERVERANSVELGDEASESYS